jgi:hypothetical protein
LTPFTVTSARAGEDFTSSCAAVAAGVRLADGVREPWARAASVRDDDGAEAPRAGADPSGTTVGSVTSVGGVAEEAAGALPPAAVL